MAVLFLSTPERAQVFRAAFAEALPEVAFHVGQAPDPEAVRWLVALGVVGGILLPLILGWWAEPSLPVLALYLFLGQMLFQIPFSYI